MHIVYKLLDIIRVTRKNGFSHSTHKHCRERDYRGAGAKPLCIFTAFSLSAKHDLIKVERGEQGAKVICKLPKCS